MADETRDFATAMRQARDRLVLTQAQLAEKVGVTGPTISNWENGKSPLPKESSAHGWKRRYGSVKALRSGSDSRTPACARR